MHATRCNLGSKVRLSLGKLHGCIETCRNVPYPSEVSSRIHNLQPKPHCHGPARLSKVSLQVRPMELVCSTNPLYYWHMELEGDDKMSTTFRVQGDKRSLVDIQFIDQQSYKPCSLNFWCTNTPLFLFTSYCAIII